MQVIIGHKIIRHNLVKNEPDEEEANDTLPEANGKHNSCNQHHQREVVCNKFKWQKQIIPEDVDFFLEYMEYLANRGHIVEKIHWSEQHFTQSSLYNLTAYASIVSLGCKISDYSMNYLYQSTEGSFVHILSVQVLLLLWVYHRVLSVYTLSITGPELPKQHVDYKYYQRQRSSKKFKQFSVGFTVWIYVFIGLIDEKFAQKRRGLGVNL